MLAANKALEALKTFRELEENLVLYQVMLFLIIAHSPGLPTRDYGKMLGLPSSSLSRYLSILNKHHGEGLGLVYTIEDEVDRRKKRVYLTPEGEQFIAKLTTIIK